MFMKKKPKNEPNSLLFYGIPKVGKTTLVSALPDSIIFDFENGTDYITHERVIPVKSKSDIANFAMWYKSQQFRAKFVILDSLTAIEEMLAKEIKDEHNAVNENKISSYMELAYGLGNGIMRDKFTTLIKYMSTLGEKIVLVGHVKKKDVSTEKMFNILNDLDLTGKLASIIPSQVDAIGYMFRSGNEITLSFEVSNDVIRGSRIKNLSNKEIKGETATEIWKQIYPTTLNGEKNDESVS